LTIHIGRPRDEIFDCLKNVLTVTVAGGDYFGTGHAGLPLTLPHLDARRLVDECVSIEVVDLGTTIIPVFNRAVLLREAVLSVLAKSYRPIEIIIVDNASSDDTAQVAAALAQAHSTEVRVAHCSSRGAGAAREVGRGLARGEFIQYLDSDGLLLPDKFNVQVATLRAAPQCAIAYGITRMRESDGRSVHVPWKGTGEAVKQLFPSMLRARWWDTSTPLYRRSIVDRAGAWFNLSSEEDWEYDCRLAAMHVQLSYVDELVSETRNHPGERLNRGASDDAERLVGRAEAHPLILRHALNAKISRSTAQMQHFSRALFLLARQCGTARLGQPITRAVRTITRQCAASARMAGRFACWRDRLRSKT
jgi:hypothetical protein